MLFKSNSYNFMSYKSKGDTLNGLQDYREELVDSMRPGSLEKDIFENSDEKNHNFLNQRNKSIVLNLKAIDLFEKAFQNPDFYINKMQDIKYAKSFRFIDTQYNITNRMTE